MNGTIHDVEAQRSRWRRYRLRQRLTLDAGDEFATGGLAASAHDIAVRLLILPGDPEADAVTLDHEALAWLKQPRVPPYGGNRLPWGSRERGARDAVVIYDQYREDQGWGRYLALHRHGGIEFGSHAAAYQLQDKTRAFNLRWIVGLVWTAAALEAKIAEQWTVAGPFEMCIAMRNTEGAILGGLAEGWSEPQYALDDYPACLDHHVLLCEELDDMKNPEGVALRLGQRIELAFGSVDQRYLGARGEYEDRFDPRF